MGFFSRRRDAAALAPTPTPLTREQLIDRHVDLLTRLRESGTKFSSGYTYVCGIGMMDMTVENSQITLTERAQAG